MILGFARLGIALFPATSGARQLATLARLTWQITLGLLASGILVQIPKTYWVGRGLNSGLAKGFMAFTAFIWTLPIALFPVGTR